MKRDGYDIQIFILFISGMNVTEDIFFYLRLVFSNNCIQELLNCIPIDV